MAEDVTMSSLMMMTGKRPGKLLEAVEGIAAIGHTLRHEFSFDREADEIYTHLATIRAEAERNHRALSPLANIETCDADENEQLAVFVMAGDVYVAREIIGWHPIEEREPLTDNTGCDV